MLVGCALVACIGLSGAVPAAAESELRGNWIGGSDVSGASTYIGRVETPRPGQSITAGANLLVSGWALDTTAAGCSGFDQMEVYIGTRDGGGTRVTSGSVGLERPDITDALGPAAAPSGERGG